MQVKKQGDQTDRTKAKYDVIFVANVARRGDVGLRIRREIEVCSDLGLRIGVRHLAGAKSRFSVSPDIQYCIRRGIAEIIPETEQTMTRLALVFSPGRLKARVRNYDNLIADRTVLIIDSMPTTSQMGLWHTFSQGTVSWAPTNRWIRAALTRLNMPVPLEKYDWRPVACPVPQNQTRRLEDAPFSVGRFSLPGADQWPERKKNIAQAYDFGPEFDFLFVGDPPDKVSSTLKKRRNWTQLGFDSITAEHFVKLIEVFAYFPSKETPELPDAAIADAMASGKIVVLPPRLRPHFGPGAIYSLSSEFQSRILSLLEDEEELKALREAAAYHATLQFPKDAYCERILTLVGKAGKRVGARKRRARDPERRVLFVPSNGVGLGHVTRCLAVARQMKPPTQPVFVTLAQGARVIEAAGFTAEYIPSHTDTGAEQKDWDQWFGHQLGNLIDAYKAEAVVFDGNNPSPGLVRAALSKGGCKLVWMRRGMWGTAVSPYLSNARFMDLIVEPGEIARERDSGVTASRRDEVLEVGQVTLLDRDELLPRKEAREAIGLSAGDPAVLIQLGAGANRDNLSLIEDIVSRLRQFQELQIVLAEWENAPLAIPALPSTKILQAYPLSKFFNAFDFSISAAGYNTYHEVMAAGLPTIFVPNRHPQLDDQLARAQFAQDSSAGFNLSEEELIHLPALCSALLKEPVRQMMSQNCLNLAGKSGAREAAMAISDLMGER